MRGDDGLDRGYMFRDIEREGGRSGVCSYRLGYMVLFFREVYRVILRQDRAVAVSRASLRRAACPVCMSFVCLFFIYFPKRLPACLIDVCPAYPASLHAYTEASFSFLL